VFFFSERTVAELEIFRDFKDRYLANPEVASGEVRMKDQMTRHY